MEEMIKANLERVKFGELQVNKHVAIVPIFIADGNGLDYLVMKEAMDSNLLIVTEVSEGGSVPELKVINKGDKPVLLLDGEELSGAKQNRVLNTSILIKELSETLIPVSCTEHGRWSYRSSNFEESGHIMSAKLRRVKNASVHENLKVRHVFQSDQGAVWDEIAIQAQMNEVSPVTGAMKDVLEAKQEDMDAFLEHFSSVTDQNGLMVLVNGEVVGFDMVSKHEAFRILYPKLIKSYIMDALLEKPASGHEATVSNAERFLQTIMQCEERKFDSIGYGYDYRYEGKKIVGSALAYGETIVHGAFFKITEAEKTGHMSSLSQRRANRTR
jgi:hypothetical protein